METLKNLAQTLSLDYSFFFHLLLACVLYFVSKKYLFQPYISALDKKASLTKGRLKQSQSLDTQIQESEELYEKKAKKIHKEFQGSFNEIRDKVLDSFSKASLKLEKEQKLHLDQERKKLHSQAREQNKVLEKEIPQLKMTLLNKITN